MTHDQFRQATIEVTRHFIDRLQTILVEAEGYFIMNNNLAAWGTLFMFEEAAEDLKTMLRLRLADAGRRMP